ncbi:MAG: BREX system P-loop protein BrxC [Candidatus Accumulibacter sp.]|nr:BREX system P-loop protein BrxC [Accumulibacter sp.]MCM8614222.1 BREX system P-loop protein BrxC [Accumulibacter sp.]MCM8638009.1 BREX system P-loop protein BrxC [Accumulibacter sp.]MCM8641347.1 BREX system P-loop protein BrxC [Accumulibacter sp.]
MKNRDVFDKDIDAFSLENQGVAKVDEALDEQQRQTLRFELETFVCRGHYEEGLHRILDSFADTLRRRHESPPAWVSGFFGSGKSHLVKMARALWTNEPFADGRTPRDIARLPSSVADTLKEIDTLARQRKTTLRAAAGTLSQGEGDSIRKAVLSIVFKAVGLPSRFDEARALMWLRDERIDAEVNATLAAKSRSLVGEIKNLYVSTHLQDAILKAKPSLARDAIELGDTLEMQFATKGDITQDDFLAYFGKAVSRDGEMPIFLLVLDELQQYIADSADRAMRVQEVIESLSKHFDGRVLLIATGQSALTGTPVLSKLLGRFAVQVQLADSDVEEVLRETVLKKKASSSQPLKELFGPAGCLGEIAAHLQGSTFAHRRDDEGLLGPSYPLLPTRQRLWERVLATTDASGTGVQLRSQLRLAFDAVRKSKDAQLGHIVGGDFIYDEIRMRLRQSSQISAETANAIDKLDGARDERSRLKARALKAVFLLTRVSSNSAQDTGLHTDAQTIADVLVDDLTQHSSALRGDVAVVLEELVAKDRLLMKVSAGGLEEYRLQTKESADWFAYQRGEEEALRSDPSAYESKIREQLMQRAAEQIRKLAIPQGVSREIRRLKIHSDPIAAPRVEGDVPVWLRSDLDGTQAKEVLVDATRAGINSAIVFAHVALPRKDELVRAIITREAAERTLGHFGEAQTPEGLEARNALAKQKRDAESRADELIKLALEQGQVVQGGGQVVDEGSTLDARLKKAGTDATTRLFRKFAMVDAPGWGKALEDAQRGLTSALEKVGHAGAPQTHPGAQEILAFIGPGAAKGNKLRERFMAEPYGWSQDAVDALLATLFHVGQLRIINASGAPWPPGRFIVRDVTASTFSRETAPLSNDEKRAIARLVKCKPDEAEACASEFVTKLKDALTRATGAAPRPEARPNELIDELSATSGRDLVKRLAEEEKAAADLLAALEAQASKIAQREPQWQQLNDLLGYMKGRAEAAALTTERDAIRGGRLLLDDPDKVEPLVHRAADALRAVMNKNFGAYRSEYERCTQELEEAPQWGKLAPEDRAAILRDIQLSAPEDTPKLGTLAELLDSLAACSPQRWAEKRDALGGQLSRAFTLAAQKLEPKAQPVSAPHRILYNEADLDAWLAEVRQTVLAKLSDGPVQL